MASTDDGLDVAALESVVSRPRLAPYRAASTDPEEAAALYLWNARVGAAFSELLGHLEVALRNEIHDALTVLHDAARAAPGLCWFDEPAWTKHHWLSGEARKSRDQALRRASAHRNRPSRCGKVVSELNFGFWRYMLSARYEQSFWVPALDGAFDVPDTTPARRRQLIEDTVEPLHQLRNRVAHHEPLFGDLRIRRKGGVVLLLPLDALHESCHDVASWISLDASRLLSTTDRVTSLLSERPG